MLITTVITLFLLRIQSIFAESCGPRFNGKCTCGDIEYEGITQYVVNCTNEGFRDTNVLKYMPEDTEVLIFTGNYVPDLPWNVFGEMNDYDQLTTVDMSNNHIREIRGKTYHFVQNVKTLILNHNNISISRYDDEVNHHHPRVFSGFVNLESLHLTNAFAENTSAELSVDLHDIFVNSNLTKLIKLHLEQNEITHFNDRRVFCDLPSLRDIYLGDNYLRELDFNLTCLRHLQFLDLRRNKFEMVLSKDLRALDEMYALSDYKKEVQVDFRDNPFSCNCKLATFLEWLKNTNLSVREAEEIKCYRNKMYPETILDLNIGRCGLNGSRFRSTTGHTVTLVFLLVVLSFILIGLVSALIYVSRDRVKYVISSVFSSVSRKVQYATIKDEECQEVYV